MGLTNALLLFWTWIRLLSKHIMSATKCLLSWLRKDLTVNFCRRKSQTSTNSGPENCGETSPSIHSFVKDFVKSNLKAVTTQIIRSDKNSDDICKVEQGIQKAKFVKKKYSKGAGGKTEYLPSSYHEISEDCQGNDISQKRLKAPRPNYFIAVQVTNSRILENAKRVQDGILENSSTDLRHLKVEVRKSHITLMAMHLADSLALDNAKLCLDQCLSTMSKTNSCGQITLEFEGLDVFSGGSVLFVTVKPSQSLQILKSLSDEIRKDMKQFGILAAGKDFKPHMTLMKYRWKKQTQNRAKRVEKNAYKKFEKEYLGTQTVASVQLCKMEGVREDGYYIVEHEVFFGS